MRFLIISQYYRPDITAAAFRIAETADVLSTEGHEVRVITAEPHRVQAEGAAPGDEPGTGPIVERVPIRPLEGSGMRPYLRHFLSFVRNARRRGRQLLRSGYQPDVIWVSSPPLFVGLAGTALARRSRAPLILDVRDVWPDTAVAAGQISQGGRAYRLGRLLERHLYRKASAISCVADPMAEYLAQQLDPQQKPIEICYNGIGYDPPPPSSADTVEQTVVYAGNLGRLQGVDALIHGWEQAVAGDPAGLAGWKLSIIGSGVMEAELREQARSAGIAERVEFRGVLSKEQTLVETSRAGMLFFNLTDHPVFALTIPSKLFDYLATGRPVIAGIIGEGRSIVESVPGNRTVRPHSPEEIARAILELAGSPDWREPRIENQELVRTRFSRRSATGKLVELSRAVSS